MRKSLELLFYGAVLGVFLMCFSAQAQFSFLEELQSPLVGQKAPGFELKDLEGRAQDFAVLSRGKDTILFFWATWCPHCREQLRGLGEKKTEIKAGGIEVLLVDLSEDARVVEAYLKKSAMNFRVLLDADGSVSENYKVYGIPTFVFIDKTGAVRRVENYLPDDYKTSFIPSTRK